MEVTLREYIEKILSEREKALDLLARNLEQRLEKLNELRAEVMRDRDQFLKRDVYDQIQAALLDRIYKMEQFQSRLLGLGGALVLASGFIGAVLMKIFFK